MKKLIVLLLIGATVMAAGRFTRSTDIIKFTQKNATNSIDSGWLNLGEKTYDCRTAIYRIGIRQAKRDTLGIGASDTVWWYIYTSIGDTLYLVDSSGPRAPKKWGGTADSTNWWYGKIPSATGDTLLKNDFRVKWRMKDSLTDTNSVIPETMLYQVPYELILKEN